MRRGLVVQARGSLQCTVGLQERIEAFLRMNWLGKAGLGLGRRSPETGGQSDLAVCMNVGELDMCMAQTPVAGLSHLVEASGPVSPTHARRKFLLKAALPVGPVWMFDLGMTCAAWHPKDQPTNNTYIWFQMSVCRLCRCPLL